LQASPEAYHASQRAQPALGREVPDMLPLREQVAATRPLSVPAPWWDDPALCIERFISNDQGRYHRAYLWQDRLAMVEAINPAPVKKTRGNVWSRTLWFCRVDGRYRPANESDPGPERLLAQVAAFAGEYYIIDVNTTPYTRPSHSEFLDHLRGPTI
jgi:hypothetical protein